MIKLCLWVSFEENPETECECRSITLCINSKVTSNIADTALLIYLRPNNIYVKLWLIVFAIQITIENFATLNATNKLVKTALNLLEKAYLTFRAGPNLLSSAIFLKRRIVYFDSNFFYAVANSLLSILLFWLAVTIVNFKDIKWFNDV